MEREKYEMLYRELVEGVDRAKMLEVIQESRPSVRTDREQLLLRESVVKSTLSMYNGVPYFYSGRIYEPLDWDELGNVMYDVMRAVGVPDGDYSRLESMVRMCRRAISVKELRVDGSLMVFRNCVYDMERGKVRRFSRDLVQVTAVDYPYRAKDVPRLWGMFLQEVLPDKGARGVLQEWLGAMFVSRKSVKIEKMCILLGSGANGKSVVFETVMGILGRENVTNFGIDALMRGSERKRNLAMMNGKRLNYCSEMQSGEIGSESDALKVLISGEPLAARAMYGENFMARDLPLLMANCNELPKLSDLSFGMQRRLCIIPFTVEIPADRQQAGLANELRAEYPGIFNWIMEGRRRFVANGYRLSEPETVREALTAYVAGSDTVTQWLYENGCRPRMGDWREREPAVVGAEALYRRYCRWCMDCGYVSKPKPEFMKTMTAQGYQRTRAGSGPYSYVVYGGLSRTGLVQLHDTGFQANGGGGKGRTAYQRRVATEYTDSKGRRKIKTCLGLSHYLAMPVGTVENKMRRGEFNGMYTLCGRTPVFDLDCIDAFVNGPRRKAVMEERAKKKEYRPASGPYEYTGAEEGGDNGEDGKETETEEGA